MAGAEALEVTPKPAPCLGGAQAAAQPSPCCPPEKGTGSLWVSPSPPSLGFPCALGLQDLTCPLSSTEERPCHCFAIRKLRHRRTAVQLCQSRDCSTSSPATALLQKPLSGTLLPPASLQGPTATCNWHSSHGPAPSRGNLHQDQALRRDSAPSPEGAWLLSPSRTRARGSSPLLRVVLPCHWGLVTSPSFSPPEVSPWGGRDTTSL